MHVLPKTDVRLWRNLNERENFKKLMTFRYTDLKAVCEYLEEMAAKGWELKSMRTFMEFRKAEPRKVRYSAELLETASVYGNFVSDDSREYIDMCEQAGWEFVCNTGKMYIFRMEDENAIEIVSDNEEKLKDIKRGTLKTYFLSWFVLPVIILLDIALNVFSIGSPVEASYLRIFGMMLCLLVVIISIIQIISFFYGIKRRKKQWIMICSFHTLIKNN